MPKPNPKPRSSPHLAADDVGVANRGRGARGHLRPRIGVDVHEAGQVVLVDQQGQQAVVREERLEPLSEGRPRSTPEDASRRLEGPATLDLPHTHTHAHTQNFKNIPTSQERGVCPVFFLAFVWDTYTYARRR